MADKYRCPITDIIDEKDLSKSSPREKWYKKRNYCLHECPSECDLLIMLKKIYWELRKPK